MKKILSIVLALALVFGFAGMTFAMGPTGADPSNVGLVLTGFYVSDSILSPLMLQNWSGTITPTKTYAEGQPIWFVAHYVQNKEVSDDDRNFASVPPPSAAGFIDTRTTVFTSSAGEVNYAYSNAYMNFALVTGIQVIGASVNSSFAAPFQSAVSTSATKLEVTMEANSAIHAPGTKAVAPVYYLSTDAANLQVAGADPDVVQNYYLQIMGFTNACNEAQGTAIAKTPIDKNELDSTTISAAAAIGLTFVDVLTFDVGRFNTGSAGTPITWVNVYDANNVVKYTVAKFTVGTHANIQLANIGAAATDNLYMVYDADGEQVIGFVSSTTAYKGMAKIVGSTPVLANGQYVVPVQYTSDAGGKYVYTIAPAGSGITAGSEAVTKSDLEAVMTFFNFSFGNSYPVLDKHFNAFAGYWKILEAKYNVAAAVISVPDPGVDIVPKTGDVSSAFGMIMVAIAGLAAVGFVMMKRVHG